MAICSGPSFFKVNDIGAFCPWFHPVVKFQSKGLIFVEKYFRLNVCRYCGRKRGGWRGRKGEKGVRGGRGRE